MKKRSVIYKIFVSFVCLIVSVNGFRISSFAATALTISCDYLLCSNKLRSTNALAAGSTIPSEVPEYAGTALDAIKSDFSQSDKHYFVVYCSSFSNSSALKKKHTLNIASGYHQYTTPTDEYKPLNAGDYLVGKALTSDGSPTSLYQIDPVTEEKTLMEYAAESDRDYIHYRKYLCGGTSSISAIYNVTSGGNITIDQDLANQLKQIGGCNESFYAAESHQVKRRYIGHNATECILSYSDNGTDYFCDYSELIYDSSVDGYTLPGGSYYIKPLDESTIHNATSYTVGFIAAYRYSDGGTQLVMYVPQRMCCYYESYCDDCGYSSIKRANGYSASKITPNNSETHLVEYSCASCGLLYETIEESHDWEYSDYTYLDNNLHSYVRSCCDPHTVDAEFALSKRRYFHITGRTQKSDIIAYHFRQSFKPGEITPEEANKIGYEFASRLLKGKHAFIVATHIDKHHIHNHIIWNSTTLDCTRKYRNPIGSFRNIRKLSDLICVEHNLSTIVDPSKGSYSYNNWKNFVKKATSRDFIRADIDKIIKQKPKTFDEFLASLSSIGYEIKQGKNLSLRHPEQKKFVRLSSLGDEYSEDVLKLIIKGSKNHNLQKCNPANNKPSLLIDIQKKMAEGKGKGYEKFAESFNLKQMSKTVLYVQEHGYKSYEALAADVEKKKNRVEELQAIIDKNNRQMDEIKELENRIIIYAKHSKVYAEYKSKKFSKQFFEEHKTEIEEYKAAKKYFDSLNLGDYKLPSIASLREEFDECRRSKNAAFDELLPLKKDYREMLIHQKNLAVILEINETDSAEQNKKKTEQEH